MNARRKRDINIAFTCKDELYKKCKSMGSSKIKAVVGVESYKELLKKSKEDDRSISNYIRHKLRIYFAHEKENPIS